MRFKPAPPYERMTDLLSYDPDTGIFTWNRSQGAAKRGSKAEHINIAGYIQIRIDGVLYLGHRLAWYFVHGIWPDKCIDHINRIRTDNRISNLRLATHTQNNVNRIGGTKNESGYKGVDKRFNRFQARIRVDGKLLNLGWFGTAEDAYAAYKLAAEKHYGDFNPI